MNIPSLAKNNEMANDKQEEQVLRGIQPRHQIAYKFFRGCKVFGIIFSIFAIVLFGTTFVKTGLIGKITGSHAYRVIILFLLLLVGVCIILSKITKALFLRRAPFDDWVFEIAEKRLGTSIIFYDSKYIFINYDRGGKEVDKREFVTEMSDKSVHYSYFYVSTDIDQGYIVVQCKKREPIPKMASFKSDDDKFWNIVPLGLTIHPVRQKVAPIGWYLNDQNKNDELLETIPSTSILICGGTGCYKKDTPILMYDFRIK